MQPTSTNGNPTTARDMLDSVRQVVEHLEAELKKQQQENQKILEERDDYRRMLVEQMKPALDRPEDWDNFDAKDYTLSIGDLLAVLKSK